MARVAGTPSRARHLAPSVERAVNGDACHTLSGFLFFCLPRSLSSACSGMVAVTSGVGGRACDSGHDPAYHRNWAEGVKAGPALMRILGRSGDS